MKKLLLIPSAQLVPLELQTEFGCISSAMIPIANQPALQYIAKPYVDQGYKVLVAVHQQAGQINRYISAHPALDARTVDVGETQSLAETICNALKSLPQLPEQLVINFGDTFVGEQFECPNTIFYSEDDDAFRWTAFDVDEHYCLREFYEKGSVKSQEKYYPLIVGVFAIHQVEKMMACLEEAMTKPTPKVDPFYDALKNYFNALPLSSKSFQRAIDWRDFGHLDTYYATKKLYFINQRFFNQVQVDAQRGIVKKTSRETQKFIHEINWYIRLPKKIKYMAPRIFDYSLDATEPFVEMEFYGYPALNDIYLYGDCDPGVWNQIFIAVANVLHEMAQYRIQPAEPESLRDAMEDTYIRKTQRRLAPILEDERFAPFCRREMIINNQLCPGLPQVFELLPQLIQDLNLYRQDAFSIIHGDLCLSNILYDRRNRLIRLIDPRGQFGGFDIYGDPRYDLAKLTHSIEGDYDFLSNGLFESWWEKETFFVVPNLELRHLRVKEIFKTRLMSEYQVSYAQIKLIESLLFLSMVPLHADRFASQTAFLARGLEIFAWVMQYCAASPEGKTPFLSGQMPIDIQGRMLSS